MKIVQKYTTMEKKKVYTLLQT